MPLPIFAPTTEPLVAPERATRMVKIGGLSIPVCEEEYALLSKAVKEHIDQHGVCYGFFAQLLIPRVSHQLSGSEPTPSALQSKGN